MDFSVKIEGLDKLDKATADIQKAVAVELDKALYASAQQVVTEAKKSVLEGGKSGRVYKRRTVIHQASAPGEAPASDTGRLVNSLHAEAGQGEALAIAGGSSVVYANMLEFGTSKMAARPFMFPAFEKSKAWIMARLQDAVRRAIG